MIDRPAAPSISPDTKAFRYNAALINLAAAITDGASEIRSPHPSIAPSLDGETAFEVIYPEKTGRRSFGLSRRANGRLTCWRLKDGKPTAAQPLRILLRKYGLRDDHPPATTPDSRVLAVLRTLDATTMTSLRAYPRFGDGCYRTLSRLGPDAPIHRFLAHSPGFGPWLETVQRLGSKSRARPELPAVLRLPDRRLRPRLLPARRDRDNNPLQSPLDRSVLSDQGPPDSRRVRHHNKRRVTMRLIDRKNKNGLLYPP